MGRHYSSHEDHRGEMDEAAAEPSAWPDRMHARDSRTVCSAKCAQGEGVLRLSLWFCLVSAGGLEPSPPWLNIMDEDRATPPRPGAVDNSSAIVRTGKGRGVTPVKWGPGVTPRFPRGDLRKIPPASIEARNRSLSIEFVRAPMPIVGAIIDKMCDEAPPVGVVDWEEPIQGLIDSGPRPTAANLFEFSLGQSQFGACSNLRAHVTSPACICRRHHCLGDDTMREWSSSRCSLGDSLARNRRRRSRGRLSWIQNVRHSRQNKTVTLAC